MERYLCIHCHFYQPPRENPWLEIVELQDSAYPYHDWNERITAECYAPNSACAHSRWRRPHHAHRQQLFAQISFNFGPTLLSWMEANSPDVYEAILEADRQSRERFSGHGSAIAQVLQPHHHAAGQPARQRDAGQLGGSAISRRASAALRKACGCRKPPSILETLEVLADHDIKFTILAPESGTADPPSGPPVAQRRRRQDRSEAARISANCRRGSEIDLFFYDGPISRAVAFETPA